MANIDDDDDYLRKRQANNAAVKKTREKKKKLQEKEKEEIRQLEMNNEKYEKTIETLDAEIAKMKKEFKNSYDKTLDLRFISNLNEIENLIDEDEQRDLSERRNT